MKIIVFLLVTIVILNGGCEFKNPTDPLMTTEKKGSIEIQAITDSVFTVVVNYDTTYNSDSMVVVITNIDSVIIVRYDTTIIKHIITEIDTVFCVPIDKPASLFVGVSELDFGPTDSVVSFSVLNQGEDTLRWETISEVGWLTVTPNKGINDANVKVAVSRHGLSPGDYSCQLSIIATDTIIQIPVHMSIPKPKSEPTYLLVAPVDSLQDPINGLQVLKNNNHFGTTPSGWVEIDTGSCQLLIPETEKFFGADTSMSISAGDSVAWQPIMRAKPKYVKPIGFLTININSCYARIDTSREFGRAPFKIGSCSYVKVPVARYILHFAADGYVDTTTTAIVLKNESTTVEMQMRRVPENPTDPIISWSQTGFDVAVWGTGTTTNSIRLDTDSTETGIFYLAFLIKQDKYQKGERAAIMWEYNGLWYCVLTPDKNILGSFWLASGSKLPFNKGQEIFVYYQGPGNEVSSTHLIGVKGTTEEPILFSSLAGESNCFASKKEVINYIQK